MLINYLKILYLLNEKRKCPKLMFKASKNLVGDGGFEPPKALPADLQSVPFGHSGNPPYTIWNWSWWTDSNPRPADYKSAALPAELHQHLLPAKIILAEVTLFVNNNLHKKTHFSGEIF